MRAIKIDPIRKKIEEVEIDQIDQLNSMYELINCQTIESVALDGFWSLYVDEEANFKEGLAEFLIKRDYGWQPIKGAALIVQHDAEGDLEDLDKDFGTVVNLTRFVIFYGD